MIRAARAGDAAALATIYNEGVDGREATFETRHREPGEAAVWLREGPVVVAERDGRVVGFARAGPSSDRQVYAGVADFGVYLTAAARGQRLGTALLEALAVSAQAAGLTKLTSRIFATNAASRAAASTAGFREVGVQVRHGRLDGRWRDCVLVERLLGEAADR